MPFRLGNQIPWYEILQLIGDEHTAHIQVQPFAIVSIVVVQQAGRRMLWNEKDTAELDVAFALEVDMRERCLAGLQAQPQFKSGAIQTLNPLALPTKLGQYGL